MIVAFVSGVLLVAFGIAAHGVIAQALVVAGVWLAKNVLLLGFLRTPAGKRTARAVRGETYAWFRGTGRRRAYRVFGFLGQVERRLTGLFSGFKPTRPKSAVKIRLKAAPKGP